MEQKGLENKINGICPSCKQDSEFEYLGVVPKDDEFFIEETKLYNCNKCNGTIAEKSINDYTTNLMWEQRRSNYWNGFESLCATRTHTSNTKKVNNGKDTK